VSILKKSLANNAVRGALTWTAAMYVRLVRWTGRWQKVGEDIPDGLLARGQPFIVAFWHGRLLMMAYAWKHCHMVHMLISAHRDGQLVSNMMERFGSKTVYGSSTKGGAVAFIQLVRILRRGEVVGITPDGPRGPRMRANPGIVLLAKTAGVPIVPLTYSASPLHIFRSWDRFALPFPFGRGVFMWGRPITIPADAEKAELEARRVELEDVLIDLTRRADEMMGRPAIEPATPTVAEASQV